MSPLRRLGRPAMLGLADALESGRLTAPFSAAQVSRHLPENLAHEAGAELIALARDGMAGHHLALLLRLLAEERQAAQAQTDRVELVWSGLDTPGATLRDTGVVVRELFSHATRTVLIASFAVDKGDKARAIFAPLARRMEEVPTLSVRLFLNVQRRHGDDRPDGILLGEFADTFRHEIWPGPRLPAVFHDPRSLALGGPTRACLHAKCVVVDSERAFVTSANFTEAAQERNIEAGVVVTDGGLARALCAQFDSLAAGGDLVLVPGLGVSA